jgi:STE24 endopeptidase
MQASVYSQLFLFGLVATSLLKFWLAMRQRHHVLAHRPTVPPAFAQRVALDAHQKAADYSRDKTRVAQIEILVDGAFLFAITLGGGLNTADAWLRGMLGNGLLQGLALFAGLGLVSGVLGLPFALYRTFIIEERYGFNKTTWRLWLADSLKGMALGAAIGGPLLAAILWLMDAMGDRWWLYSWMVWLGFNLLMLWLYPTVIAPLFNKFSPLQNDALMERINALLARCGFTSSGLFVMDGSRRSAHGNAYFTGFGKAKRIVFFDTLLVSLSPPEIEAVLAHELGHFHHRHVLKRFVVLALVALALLWGASFVMSDSGFFTGLGVDRPGTAMALLLFSVVLPVVMFPLTPLIAALSRRDEFQADAYAAKQASANDLATALVKMYQENAATLTPDPLHSLFYDSHPAANDRIQRLLAHAVAPDLASVHA